MTQGNPLSYVHLVLQPISNLNVNFEYLKTYFNSDLNICKIKETL